VLEWKALAKSTEPQALVFGIGERTPETFECVDRCAGYFVSRMSVTPICIEPINDVLLELRRRGADVRILPNLWPLRDAVVASTLQFSMIRMRNAFATPLNELIGSSRSMSSSI
jgi:hypothetical protein